MESTVENLLHSLEVYPRLRSLCADLVYLWPQHASAVAKNIGVHSARELALLDELASRIDTLSTNRAQLIADYRWMCEQVLKEEIHFRRTGSYRCKSLNESIERVYSDSVFMGKYLQGILLSQIFWSNHAKCYTFFGTNFLPLLGDPYDYLEVGPGHGLFVSCVAKDARSRRVVGVDVSEHSLSQTMAALRCLGANGKVELMRSDVIASPLEGAFDAIAISEVLEHMEQPYLALRKLRKSLRPGGLMFINFPINSPAPDHIYLLQHPDEVRSMIDQCGYRIVEFEKFPMAGYSLERAMAMRATVSCVAVVTPKAI